ncbi:MAG: DNA polymerase III subunit gamma/tau [Candidatus Omnitrophica bacterium]|nr:DNA polymerase III subunit gamma/tau [Candidatus Omnitrophota bacterium]
MSYIVIARKWRPQVFDEIVGQGHITTTLQNAIKQDRVAHAYILCGPRGIGKTTTARIFAKALNCQKGPSPNPCNQCPSCKDITASKSVDVIEIDGASNRGIEEIRNLQESVKFSPQSGRYKIYIIDEVHMLTTEAFNALLKTLEEPPAHVKFIFATTAAHKVIPTVLSRCQRFNFKRLSAKDISEKLKQIAKKEKIAIDEQALTGIVRQAGGSMRDAESIMDQLATYCKDKITIQDTNSILGLVSREGLELFAGYIIGKDTSSAIRFVNKIIDEGADPDQFLLSLIEYFRNAMLIMEGEGLYASTDLAEEEIKSISEQFKGLTREDILYMLYSMINTANTMRSYPMPKIALELMAVKLSRKDSIVSLNEILHRLRGLEKKSEIALSGGQTPTVKPATADSCASAPESPKPAVPDSQPDISDAESRPDLYRIREALQQVIKNIRQEKIYIASCLEEGKLTDFKNNTVIFVFPKKNTFHKESLEKPQNRELIESNFSKVLSAKIKVEFILNADSDDADAQAGQKGAGKTLNPMKKALSDPIIKSALDIFDGNIMKFM